MLFAGFTQAVDADDVRRVQIDIGAAFACVDGIGADGESEQLAYLTVDPDSRPLLRTLLGLRHDAALHAFNAESDDARSNRLMRDLPSDAVERVFALGFALEQLHKNLIDLADCTTEFAQPGIASIAKLKKTRAGRNVDVSL